MKLLTKELHEKLVSNHQNQDGSKDFEPVVKLFGGGACTWLLSELDPVDNIAFGLCDLGMGFPELGSVSLDELEQVRFKPFNLGVERDTHWKATKTLTEYADVARKHGRILS